MIRKRTTQTGPAYDVRLRDPAGRVYNRTFRARREAIAWEAEEKAARSRGGWIDPRLSRSITLASLAEEWLGANPGKRGSSWARDESALRVHLLPSLGARTVACITPADVQQLVNDLAHSLSPRSVKRVYGVLRAVLNLGVAREVLVRSPCRGIRLPSVTPVDRRIPTPDDLARLSAAVEPDVQAMLWLGAVLGLRWGEVAGLRVGRLDFLRGTVTVAEQVTRSSRGKVAFGEPKSAAGRRTMAASAPLMEMLARLLSDRGLTGADETELVFVSPLGGPLDYAHWRRRVWRPAVESVGLVGLQFHDLRRLNATALVAEGVDLKTAQSRLGHSDPRLTLAVYAQATTDGDRRAAELVSARLFGVASEVSSLIG